MNLIFNLKQMNTILWYEYTFLLNETYYLTISLEWDYSNFESYTNAVKLFNKCLDDILKNEFIYINKTNYEFDYENIPIKSSLINKIFLYHIEPRISNRILQSKYYYSNIDNINFKMDSKEELVLSLKYNKYGNTI